jgi:hypothetical protein
VCQDVEAVSSGWGGHTINLINLIACILLIPFSSWADSDYLVRADREWRTMVHHQLRDRAEFLRINGIDERKPVNFIK